MIRAAIQERGPLTVAAFTTLVIDVLGDGRSPYSLPPAAAFVLLATFGSDWASRNRRLRYAYIGMLLLLGLGVFAFSAALSNACGSAPGIFAVRSR